MASIKANKRERLFEARSQGFKEYDPGTPCRKGHVCSRYTKGDQCTECAKIARAKMYAKHSYSKYAYQYKYGLSKYQYDQMLIDQHNKCALCLTEFVNTKPLVDHCHTTGEVRSLLCSHCNSMLGFAKDNPATLRAGAKYLELFHK